MNEKYNTLSLVELKAIAKAQGIKNTSSMRKAQLVQILSDLEEQQNKQKGQDGAKETDGGVETAHKEPKKVRAKASGKVQSGTKQEKREASGSTDREKREGSGSPDRERREVSENHEKSFSSEKSSASDKSGAGEKNGMAERNGAGERHGADEKSSMGERNSAGEKTAHGTGHESSGAYGRTNRNPASRSAGRSTRQENTHRNDDYHMEPALEELDSGNMAHGILEVMPDGFGFIRCENYLPGDNDIYVSPAQIRRFNLKTGDIIEGNIKVKLPTEKFSALLFVRAVNGFHPSEASKRMNFEDMTPIFPDSRIFLETERASVPMRIVDLVSPIGKGQRGMIVAPPKTGKTTLLKQIAKSVHSNYPEMNMIILLIDERPEEVTDIKEYIEGDSVEVIYSTFDELPEHHKRVSEMVLERAKRLVEHKKDVVILLDSITRLARAYNLTVPPSGRTLSGGLDPAALHMPKKFFGAARNMREGGSLTVLATALVETGSKMDDVVYEEFKGTGNMELVLDRRLSEKRIFPAIDIARSGTRREELLLGREELEATYLMRKALSGMKSDEALERIIEMFMRTRSNKDFIAAIKRTKLMQ